MPPVGGLVVADGPIGNFNAATSTLDATSVETLAGIPLANATPLEVEGYITRFTNAADFDVNGISVQTDANTSFDGGSAASLALNVKVEVEGKTNASSVLVADKVKIESTGAARIEGNIEQIEAARQRLTALGVTFEIRPETDLNDKSNADVNPLTFGDIAVGDRIEMRGFLEGGSVVASELDREDSRAEARLRGQVTAKNAAASQVQILGVTVTGSAATQYQGAADQAAFFNAVQVGDFVNADWNNFTSTGLPADELSLEDE
jgi:hypothetical protein